MIDRFLYPRQERLLRPVARWLVRRGATADGLTVAGFALGLSAVPFLWGGYYGAALVGILLNRLFDGLDGAVARVAGPTDRGAFLDISFDFFFYATIPFGFALADPGANALAAAALVTAFVGTGSSFLAFAILSERRGIARDAYPTKGIQYLGGLTEGAETIALFVAMCLWPAQFPALAFGFAILCLITTGLRWHHGWAVLAAPGPSALPHERLSR
ncbi:CDP-alcohol phosphatidyltransferase family protein [Rhodobacter capsulatus]|uniref:CDP-alcohol phosphatidyltransferase family protein n=1 Tax=Rhodobacter capsulatus TaxID=1061 RepID=UPI0003D2BF24|nr:CDP-alcohol phosphatidyltransferase family protein [Rhodobacter capsulatus]ETD87280.1 membrane protein [Rhodobacter capsulatus YW2]